MSIQLQPALKPLVAYTAALEKTSHRLYGVEPVTISEIEGLYMELVWQRRVCRF